MKYRNKIRLGLLTVVAAGIAAAQPKIDSIVNNYSFAPPGSPSYGIAQGSLFALKGTGLGLAQTPSLPDLTQGPLTTSLSGVSVSITVGGVTAQAPLYYVFDKQIAGILPSATPVGTGTVTVTFNGQTSAAAPITVVAAAFGLSGGMLNAANLPLAPARVAHPGDTVILWGSGLGAAAGDETKYPFPQADLTSKSNVKVYIGGQSAAVAYAGRSAFPAVDQINVVVPQGVSGCNVGVVVQTGNFVGNTATIPVAASGTFCSDTSTTGLTPTDYQDILNKGSVRSGYILVGKTTTQTPGISVGGISLPSSTSTSDYASAAFSQYTASQFTSTGGGVSIQQTSLGSCTTYQIQIDTGGTPPTVVPPVILDAGVVTMRLPNSSSMTLTKNALGTYSLNGSDAQGSRSPLFIPATGGLFSFTNTGGADVGAISGAQITMPPALNWTNIDAINTVVRAQGVTVNWNTSNPYSGFVTVTGSSFSSGALSGTNAATLFTQFTCTAPYSAGTFNVPPYILLALVPGQGSVGGITIPTGSLSLGLNATPVRFTAPSIDYAFLTAISTTGKSVNYQ
ncbi:MAG: hypothetical protein ABJF23_22830 [Bryobacteraceae bacterium]